ncbi:Fc.00g002540.m01.CDS01 [Cosmosporella sp. VM-42]
MPADIPKPPYDPQLATVLSAIAAPPDFLHEHIPILRDAQNAAATLETTLANEPFTHEERSVPTSNGFVIISIFRPKGVASSRAGQPGIYYMHSGGMICGNRFTGMKGVLQWGRETGAICITVEYRLAPEHPYPAPLEDSYAGLKWVSDHAGELGINPKFLMVAGQSAGGNLATAMTLLSRDRNGPKLCAQLLDSPMLDDRMETNSSHQFIREGSWSRGSNETAWNAYLGSSVGKPSISAYAAPSRATDVSNLPPAFICAGSAEIFRDESVAYAQKLWAAGVQCELHVWPGGWHCFDMMVPENPVSKVSIETRAAWVRRTLAVPVEGKL